MANEQIFPIIILPKTRRTRVIDIKTSERNGQVVGVEACTPQTDLVIITSAGKAIRFNVSDVSVVGRNTQRCEAYEP